MSDTPPSGWLTCTLRRAPGTDTGTLTHGELSTPVRNIHKQADGVVAFEAMVDDPFAELLARLYAVVQA